MESIKEVSEIEALKTKLRATWMAGDFGVIAKLYSRGAEEFVDRLKLKPGTKVLDVACGTGNLAIPAARTGAVVTGVDIAPNLIDQAREDAAAEGIEAVFDVGDTEDLPYSDGSFDVVMTMFGAMFAPRPELVARELRRVCRPGGTIAMANWTPGGFVGQMFKLMSAFVPPPPMPSPILWGDRKTVSERFAEGIADLQMTERVIEFVFPHSPEDVVELFRKFYGPTNKAFDALDEARQAELRKELELHWSSINRAEDGSTLVSSEYLEVIAVRS